MLKKNILVILLIIFSQYFTAQNFSDNPYNAVFETSDTDLFWKQFDKIGTSKENPFQEYIEKGSLGVKGFINGRIINADSLLAKVNIRKADYLSSKNVLKDISSKRKKLGHLIVH